MRYIRWGCIAIYASLFLMPGLIAADTIRLTNGEWPPYTSKALPHYGYLSHIVTEAFALEDSTVEYEFFPWKRAFNYVTGGRDWDGSVGWYKTPEREQAVLFPATPVTPTREVFFYRTGYEFDWQTVADLAGHRIGALLGFSHVDVFEEAQQAGIELTLDVTKTEVMNLKKLLAGRIDIFPCEEAVCRRFLRQQFSAEERASLQIHPKPWNETPVYMVINKQNSRAKELLHAFERGIQQLHESGRYDQMRQDFLNGAYDQ